MTSSDSAAHFPHQELCERAVSSPSSITSAERALIEARPDPDTENALYLAKTSLTLSELISKALATPPALSPEEAHVLVHGPVDRTFEEKAARRDAYRALTGEQRELVDRASAITTPPDEKKARIVAYRVVQSAKAKERAGQAGESHIHRASQETPNSHQDHPRPIVLPWERTDWITMVREDYHDSWGIYVLRTAYDDPAAWLTFKTRLSEVASYVFNQIAGPLVANRFKIKYVEDEEALAGAEQAGLLDYYARLVQDGQIESGFSWGVFVTADETVLEISSAANQQLVVPVWESGWTAGKIGEAGWNGALAMKAELVFQILMPKLVRGEKRSLEDLAMMATGR